MFDMKIIPPFLFFFESRWGEKGTASESHNNSSRAAGARFWFPAASALMDHDINGRRTWTELSVKCLPRRVATSFSLRDVVLFPLLLSIYSRQTKFHLVMMIITSLETPESSGKQFNRQIKISKNKSRTGQQTTTNGWNDNWAAVNGHIRMKHHLLIYLRVMSTAESFNSSPLLLHLSFKRKLWY